MIDFRNMRDARDLADYVGCAQSVVDRLLGRAPTSLFVVHQIPKRGRRGGFRTVWAVHDREVADAFKSLRRRLDDFMFTALPNYPDRAAHGYIVGRSTRSNAAVHLGCPLILKVDIKNFFHSITRARVEAFLRQVKLQAAAAEALSKLLTFDGHLQLGIHTSPTIANGICHEMDQRIAALVVPFGGRYSRYADDLTFSGAQLPSRSELVRILALDGFEIAEEKWRVVRRGRGLFVTGLSLEAGDYPRVPKEFKRRLRQELYYAKQYGLAQHIGTREYPSLSSGVNKIHGRIQYLRGIERRLGDELNAQWMKLLADAELEVSYPTFRNTGPRRVLFCVDEAVIRNSVLALGVVVVEDRGFVTGALHDFREWARAYPGSTTSPSVFDREGLHYNSMSEDLRTKLIEEVARLPLRAFVAFSRLSGSDKDQYVSTYVRLFNSLMERRFLLYDGCELSIAVEKNSSIAEDQLRAAVVSNYARLVANGSRRPASEPALTTVGKLEEECIALPDAFLGVFEAYADLEHTRAKAVREKKKTLPGHQATVRFDLLRDKIRMIQDLDSAEVFSRRRPFRPWPLRSGSATP
jgi:RNA-directed DNA polymerase